MKNSLLVGIAVVALAFTASQVMSEAAADKDAAISGDSSIHDRVQQLRDDINRIVRKHDIVQVAVTKEAALLEALDAYLDEDRLGKIIIQLDAFVKQSPESPRAAKAAAAIELLKGQGNNTVDSRTFERPDPTAHGRRRKAVQDDAN